MADCLTRQYPERFEYVRIESPAARPLADETAIDVAVLDMHHGWPNLGHEAIVHALQNIACDLLAELSSLRLKLRVASYDVRRGRALPPPPGGTCAIYVGTGGPGHIDPALNDGIAPESQGVREDPRWEEELFRLFDAIRADEEAALIGVCHTFGVMCRWLGVAEPVLRPASKGGKSSGVLENVLSEHAVGHPWFRRFAARLPDGRRLRILDSRLFDLMPLRALEGADVLAIGFESGEGDAAGDALTMMEVERDVTGRLPRVFGVNHHPEIVNRGRQMTILESRLRRGDVTRAWYDERARLLTETMPDEDSDARLRLTSSYTMLAPLRYYVYRQVRLRAQALGRATTVHEGLASLAVDALTPDAAGGGAVQEGV